MQSVKKMSTLATIQYAFHLPGSVMPWMTVETTVMKTTVQVGTARSDTSNPSPTANNEQ